MQSDPGCWRFCSPSWEGPRSPPLPATSGMYVVDGPAFFCFSAQRIGFDSFVSSNDKIILGSDFFFFYFFTTHTRCLSSIHSGIESIIDQEVHPHLIRQKTCSIYGQVGVDPPLPPPLLPVWPACACPPCLCLAIFFLSCRSDVDDGCRRSSIIISYI